MHSIRRLTSTLGAFFLSTSFAFSADVTSYPDLANAINLGASTLNITVPEINWPANSPLTIAYSPAFTGVATFNGQDASALFTVSAPGSPTWDGDFVFTQGRASGTGGAMYIINGATAIFNGSATFTQNRTTSAGGYGGAALRVNNVSTATFNGPTTFSNNTSANYGGGAILTFLPRRLLTAPLHSSGTAQE